MGGIHSQDSDNESDYYRLDNFRPSDDYSDSDYDIDDRYSDDNPQSDNDYDSDSTHMTDLPNAQNLDDWSDLSEFENLQTERNDSIHENVGTDYDPNIPIDSDSQDMTDNEDETFPNVESRNQSPDLFADEEGPPDFQDMTDNEDETFPNVKSRNQSPDLFAACRCRAPS